MVDYGAQMTPDSESPSTILAESGGVQLIHCPDADNGDFSVVYLPGSGGNVGRDVHLAVLVDPQDRSDAAVQWHGTPGSAQCTAWFSDFDSGYDVVEFRGSPTPLIELEVHNEADFVQTRSEWRLMTVQAQPSPSRRARMREVRASASDGQAPRRR